MLNNPTGNQPVQGDQSMQGNVMGQQLVPGTPVYGSGGAKVGTVSEYNTEGNYVVVQKGWLFPHDIYVPVNAITNTDANGAYLNMTKDEIKNQNWDNPPTSGWGSGANDTGANDTNMARTGSASAAGNPDSPMTGTGRPTNDMDVANADTARRERVRLEGVGDQGNLETTDPNVVPFDDADNQPSTQR